MLAEPEMCGRRG